LALEEERETKNEDGAKSMYYTIFTEHMWLFASQEKHLQNENGLTLAIFGSYK